MYYGHYGFRLKKVKKNINYLYYILYSDTLVRKSFSELPLSAREL